jgi:hypothetical protein
MPKTECQIRARDAGYAKDSVFAKATADKSARQANRVKVDQASFKCGAGRTELQKAEEADGEDVLYATIQENRC